MQGIDPKNNNSGKAQRFVILLLVCMCFGRNHSRWQKTEMTKRCERYRTVLHSMAFKRLRSVIPVHPHDSRSQRLTRHRHDPKYIFFASSLCFCKIVKIRMKWQLSVSSLICLIMLMIYMFGHFWYLCDTEGLMFWDELSNTSAGLRDWSKFWDGITWKLTMQSACTMGLFTLRKMHKLNCELWTLVRISC